MAVGTIPHPGKVVNGVEIGPCVNEDCGHIDCDRLRETATAICDLCGEPIGYETRFYEGDLGYHHAACLEELDE